MATKESIAIRRDLAAQSIQASLAQIGERVPDMPVLQLVRYERDLDERNAALLEEAARGMAHVARWFAGQSGEPESGPESEQVSGKGKKR